MTMPATSAPQLAAGAYAGKNPDVLSLGLHAPAAQSIAAAPLFGIGYWVFRAETQRPPE
jgi:hypothetical protein